MKIILVGASGKMGREVTKFVLDTPHDIVAEIDSHFITIKCDKQSVKQNNSLNEIINNATTKESSQNKTIISNNIFDAPPADVIIDFSTASSRKDFIAFAKEKGLAYCLFSTAVSRADLKRLKTISKTNRVLISSNTSRGIQAVLRLTDVLTSELCGADIRISEAHHKLKKDRPSGTALILKKYFENSKSNIEINSIRAGNVCGTHTLSFYLDNEVLTITHEVLNRSVFASGAVKIAEKLLECSPGFYEDFLN